MTKELEKEHSDRELAAAQVDLRLKDIETLKEEKATLTKQYEEISAQYQKIEMDNAQVSVLYDN